MYLPALGAVLCFLSVMNLSSMGAVSGCPCAVKHSLFPNRFALVCRLILVMMHVGIKTCWFFILFLLCAMTVYSFLDRVKSNLEVLLHVCVECWRDGY